MALGMPARPREKLGVIPMAVALVVAAFLGAGLGLVWQSSGLGNSDSEEAGEADDSSAGEAASEASDTASPASATPRTATPSAPVSG